MGKTDETTKQAKRRGVRIGTVASVSGDKTIRVDLEDLVKHRLYQKYMRRRTRLVVHDPRNAGAVGDMVEVVPCRPMSKRKSWRLVRVVRSKNASQ